MKFPWWPAVQALVVALALSQVVGYIVRHTIPPTPLGWVVLVGGGILCGASVRFAPPED